VLHFAECLTLGKDGYASVWLCRVRHSAKSIFAECPTFGTRQSRRHSAKPLFPVVNATYSAYYDQDINRKIKCARYTQSEGKWIDRKLA